MTGAITAKTLVAGVAGQPVRHSLSPIIHNAWIARAGIDAIYIAFAPSARGFIPFAEGLRGGVIRGVNVTAPFKEEALALAETATDRARAAGSANLLIFSADGRIQADNTDGEGLLCAFYEQAPAFDPTAGPVVILGAGGAARGAAAAFLAAGAPTVRFVNRGVDRAQTMVRRFGDRAGAFAMEDVSLALRGAAAVINATPVGLHGAAGPAAPLEMLEAHAVVMDMVYRPVETEFLRRAKDAGLKTVDGLAMLIAQARPSFEAFFDRPPPPLDMRGMVLAALEP